MQASPAPPLEGLATQAAAAPAPLITGPVEMLWLLALSVIFIMALVFVLLLRSRAAKPAKRRPSETEFFKPAGEGAEITFDDTFDDTGPQTDHAARSATLAPTPRKNRAPFAGLFAPKERKAAVEPSALTEIDLETTGDDDFATVRIERDERFAEHEAADTIDARLAGEIDAEREIQRRAAQAEFERERRERDARLFEEDERRRRDAEIRQQQRLEEDARRAAPAREPAFAPAYAPTHTPAHMPAFAGDAAPARYAPDAAARYGADDVSRTLFEVEEAMTVQREAIQSETRALLDAFSQRLYNRLDAIAAAVDRTPAAAAMVAPSAALDEIARDIALVRERLDRAAAVDPAALQQELALLRQAITGPRDTPAPAVQLADVIRNALSPDAYEMPANLSNSRRADCLVKLPRPSGPIAIDARFPAEAFSILRSADARRGPEAENEFRRLAIRHVVDIAERLIAPGETADAAIMFIPTEAMYLELHHRFADVVQDAWRARVWIVSPTTLMATLHTIKAALSAAEPRGGAAFLRDDASRMTGEMTDLRRRIGALEEALTRAPPARSAYHLSTVGRGVAAPSTRAGAGDRIGDLAGEPMEAGDIPPPRPLFPLR